MENYSADHPRPSRFPLQSVDALHWAFEKKKKKNPTNSTLFPETFFVHSHHKYAGEKKPPAPADNSS